MENLTISDLDDLTMLINITESIYNLYEQIYKLEVNGKKDTDECENLIEELKSSIELQSSIFARLTTSFKKINSLYKYICEKAGIPVTDGTVSFVLSVNADKDSLVLHRIANLLSVAFMNEMMKGNKEEISSVIGIDYEEIPEEFVSKVLNLKLTHDMYITTDIASLTLAILEKDELSSEYVKGLLAWVKYVYGFVLPDIEKTLVNNKFNVELNPFVINYSVKNIFGVPDEAVQIELASFTSLLMPQQVEYVALQYDFDMINPQVVANAKVCEASIRAMLLLVEEKIRKEYINKVEELIIRCEEHPNKMARTILKNSVSKYEEDKLIPQVISWFR